MGRGAHPTAAGTFHVIGAGMAGLACAVHLARAGRRVLLYEATDHAGGRCRSFFDTVLGQVINNGNHLLLSGNEAVFGYLEDISARDTMVSAPRAVFPFMDLRTGQRWTLRPNRGRIPWWIFSASRRVPGTRAHEYLAALRLCLAGDSATVADYLDTGRPIFERFWKPLAVAVLNIAPEEGAARLLWPVMALTFGRGEAACRPCIARNGLSASLVDPAMAFLRQRGAKIHLGHRLRALAPAHGRICGLDFGNRQETIGNGDAVILAVPPASAARLLPGHAVPTESRPIVNIHFRLPEPARLPDDSPLLGLVGGAAEWIFVRGEIASVTVSAAADLAQAEAAEIAARIWPEVARALALSQSAAAPPPPYRVIKERHATFAQTPAMLRLRAKTRTSLANLFLAGDWTDTGLPATIEGAVLSGRRAAQAAQAAGAAPGT